MCYYDKELINEIMDNEERALQDYYADMAAEAAYLDECDAHEAASAYDESEYIDEDF